jgi:menaquinone-dependent protoporphyrinogen oxidase
MVRILVTTASKHGSTHEIGDAIAASLESTGIEAYAQRADDVTSLDGVDAVILGSGVYAGRWLEPAKAFVSRFERELQTRPIWLFSSGPLGDPPVPAGDPVDVADLVAASGARGHRVFAGRLNKDNLGFGERTIVKMVHAPFGDFRDWADIRSWALEIAGTFTPQEAMAG